MVTARLFLISSLFIYSFSDVFAQPAMVGEMQAVIPGQEIQLNFDYLGTGSNVVAGQFELDISTDQIQISSIICTAPFICSFDGNFPVTVAFLNIMPVEIPDTQNAITLMLQAAASVQPGTDLQIQINNELYVDVNSLPVAANNTQNGVLSLPVYFETFFNGLPADWSNVDASGNNALWTWCSDPLLGQINGCPALWDDAGNQQTAYAANTAVSGFVTLDSNFYGPLSSNHLSELTSAPIDLSTVLQVEIRFESHLGVNTLDAEDNAILRISNNNGASWETFTVFPGLVTGNSNPPFSRWSQNPQASQINISSVAGGQANVLLQWQWQGNNEFHWSLDDIALIQLPPPELIFSNGFE